MLRSFYRPIGPIVLPPPTLGRQHYMHTFWPSHPTVPEGCDDYLPAVKALLAGLSPIPIEGQVHLTIDEKIVKAGMSQRRPGPHVDGCFMAVQQYWGHEPEPGGVWNHNCNNVPREFVQRMPVVVAASVPGCRAWIGNFEGVPKGDGDLSHLSLGEGEVLPANVGYLLSPDCIHESMVFAEDTPRTFVRLALPNTFEYYS